MKQLLLVSKQLWKTYHVIQQGKVLELPTPSTHMVYRVSGVFLTSTEGIVGQ